LDGAWRPLARQEFLFRKALAGGNVASNPYSGQRMHMRGGAFDLVRTDSSVQAACRAVGLIRDPAESWHWNNPRMTTMPIITANTAPAGTGGTPINIGDEDVVTAADIEAIAERTAKKIFREFWVGDSDPLNKTFGAVLYEQLVNTRSTKTTVEQTEKAVANVGAAVGGIKTPAVSGGTVTIDYDLLANKVADKLAARLVS